MTLAAERLEEIRRIYCSPDAIHDHRAGVIQELIAEVDRLLEELSDLVRDLKKARNDQEVNLDALEARAIETAFYRFGGNRALMHEALGISPRGLAGKMRSLGYRPRQMPSSGLPESDQESAAA